MPIDADRLSLGQICRFACASLPRHWDLRINLTRDYLQVSAIDPEGITFAADSRHSAALRVLDLVNYARETEGLEPVKLPGGDL